MIQHGKSKSKEEDPTRPLTDEGVKETEAIAKFFGETMGLKAKNLIHSPKLRAKQTAEIVKKYIPTIENVLETDAVSPLSDPRIISKKLEELTGDTIIVGHLPHLSRLTSYLLCGDPEKEIVQFRYSGILCIEKKDDHWVIKFFITPDLIPDKI